MIHSRRPAGPRAEGFPGAHRKVLPSALRLLPLALLRKKGCWTVCIFAKAHYIYLDDLLRIDAVCGDGSHAAARVRRLARQRGRAHFGG